MCLLCVLRVRKLNVERLRELCCAWEQLSSFSVDARCLFYHRQLCQKQNAGLWPIAADPSRGEAVGRSDESSFRNEQGCSHANKTRHLGSQGSLGGPGLI